MRIKWPAPLSMRKLLVLLRALAGNIPALIKMITAVVLREKCSTTGKGQFKCWWSGVPSRAVPVVSPDQEAERTRPDRTMSRYKI